MTAGTPLGSMALRALSSSPLKNVVVVVHPDDPKDWLQAEGMYKAASPVGPTTHVVACAEASQGMSHSIRCGLQALMADEPGLDAIVVTLADQPFITADMIAGLVHYWRERPELDFIASAAQDAEEQNIVLMPPAILSRSMFSALLQLKGDAGARKLFQSPEFKGCGLIAADRKTLLDVDNTADMEIARNMIRADSGRANCDLCEYT